MMYRQIIVKIISKDTETSLLVKVADTQQKRDKGLMFVTYLPENEGMLFMFPGKRYGGFWMKNTWIPLSIAFLDSDGKILKILDMQPCTEATCPTYDPGISYKYALEVNLGWFKRNKMKEGDYVKFN